MPNECSKCLPLIVKIINTKKNIEHQAIYIIKGKVAIIGSRTLVINE